VAPREATEKIGDLEILLSEAISPAAVVVWGGFVRAFHADGAAVWRGDDDLGGLRQ